MWVQQAIRVAWGRILKLGGDAQPSLEMLLLLLGAALPGAVRLLTLGMLLLLGAVGLLTGIRTASTAWTRPCNHASSRV